MYPAQEWYHPSVNTYTRRIDLPIIVRNSRYCIHIRLRLTAQSDDIRRIYDGYALRNKRIATCDDLSGHFRIMGLTWRCRYNSGGLLAVSRRRHRHSQFLRRNSIRTRYYAVGVDILRSFEKVWPAISQVPPGSDLECCNLIRRPVQRAGCLKCTLLPWPSKAVLKYDSSCVCRSPKRETDWNMRFG